MATITPFILHHYEVSPFAEKIRLMMGLTDQAWGSVLSPPYPPRPNVDPLTGGYRRIPIAQLGADLFCDTSLIAREVAVLTDTPALAPGSESPEAEALAARAEREVFFSAITALSPPQLLAQLLTSLGPLGAARFVRDRLGMMRQAAISPPSGREARQKLETFIADVNTWVEGRNDIGQDLTYADFCIYHPLWLAQNIGSGSAIEAHEALANWMAHMAGLGQGKREEQEQAAAFSAAADNAPRPLPDDVETHECVCERVRIAPDDYGNVPVTGELVAVTRDRYILARETKRFGTLHVHFPRTGYRLTAS